MPPEALLYRWFAKAYGWTPQQVAELPAAMFDWLPAIEMAHDEALEKKRRMEEAKNSGRSR